MGIAVEGSTDAARLAADIVLTEPGLSTIIHGIIIARCIFERIRNFITYRIAATLLLNSNRVAVSWSHTISDLKLLPKRLFDSVARLIEMG